MFLESRQGIQTRGHDEVDHSSWVIGFLLLVRKRQIMQDVAMQLFRVVGSKERQAHRETRRVSRCGSMGSRGEGEGNIDNAAVEHLSDGGTN